MRRVLAALAVAATVLCGAGCSSDSDAGKPSSGAGATPSAGSGSSAGVPGGSQPPVTGNGRQVCTAARKLTTDKVTIFVTQLGRSLEASSAGDTKTAEAARTAAERALREWGAGLRDQAAKADDARLRDLLKEMSTVAGKITADPQSVDDAKLDQLEEQLEQVCGG
jgi:hypothetical protein